MITAEQIREILSLYAKHGWILRRVLLSDNLRDSLADDLFGNAEIVASRLDALWFSRASANDREAWEIRHLSKTPFALVEVFAADTDAKTREKIMSDAQTRLLNQTSNSKF